MKVDKYGKMKPFFDFRLTDENVINKIEEVCPFSDISINEDILGKELYGKTNNYLNKLGYVHSTFAGYIKEGDYRMLGSSGGFGSWILNHLLEENLVDGVIHVGDRRPTKDDNRLFEYKISKTTEEIIGAAKSKYYPIELSGVLQLVIENPGNYVLVGIPCFVKAVRNLSKSNDLIRERIKYTVGLVCGHLKSKSFAEMLAWQLNVKPDELTKIDFRNKLKNFGANQYGITASKILNGNEVETHSQPVNKMYGTNWGLGMFKYKACDFCDDVTAETADITIGDAWLPKYIDNPMGTNIIIVRNNDFIKILEKAKLKNLIHIESLEPDEVIKSQSSGLFHRREGLAYRLFETDKSGEWRPQKRIIANNNLPKKIKKIQNLRVALYKKSHLAFLKAKEEGSLQIFKNEMQPLINKYNKLYKTSFLQRVKRKIKAIFKK